MTSVLGFLILAKFVGAAKELVLAASFGVGELVDAYVFGMALFSWLPALWFSVLGVTYIPLRARWLREQPGAWLRFDQRLLHRTVLVGVVGTCVAVPLVLVLIRHGVFGLPDASAAVLGASAFPLALVLLLGMPIALLSMRLMAGEHHANTLYEGIPALTILLALLVVPNPGIATLAWATVGGFVLELVALGLTGARVSRGAPRPAPAADGVIWGFFLRGLGVMLAGEFLMSLITLVDQFMAARLDAGALSSLSYATRLLALVLTVVVTVASRAMLPVLSRRVALGEAAAATAYARRWALAALAGGWVVAGIGWLLAPWAVELLFERGAFTTSDTEVVAGLVRLGLIQLPFYASGTILVQALAAMGRLPALARVAAMNLGVKIVANLALVPLLGAGGLLLANAVMYAGSASAFWWISRPRRTT